MVNIAEESNAFTAVHIIFLSNNRFYSTKGYSSGAVLICDG